MTTSTPELYIHGTAPEEQQRLSLMNAILNQASVSELCLSGGERVLDLGSGLGQLTRDMARAAGVRVVAIERSQEQVANARRLASEAGEEALVDFREGDAIEMPLTPDEWGSFEVVHTRFLLEHVPDPLAVVQAMVRAARPGGRIVLEDDDHDVLRLHPESPGFTALWCAYCRAYDRMGNDPYVGRRLASLLHQAGAQPVRSTWISFGTCAGDPRFRLYTDNLIGIVTGARDSIVGRALLEARSFEAAVVELRQWSARPDAAMWYAMSWAEGRKPE